MGDYMLQGWPTLEGGSCAVTAQVPISLRGWPISRHAGKQGESFLGKKQMQQVEGGQHELKG